MRYLLTLAAAASLLAACHNRSEDEVGAAPDRGDTTAVATDTTMGQVPADTTAVQPSQDAGMSADTTAAPTAPTADTTAAAPADTTAAAPADTTGAAPADSTKQ